MNAILLIIISSTILFFVAYKYKFITLSIYIIISGFQLTFIERSSDEFYNLTIYKGFKARDLLLFTIIIAILIRLIFNKDLRTTLKPILFPTILFTLWSLFSIIKNIPAYQQSTVHEFSEKYLFIFAMFYIIVFFDRSDLKKLFKIFTVFPIFLVFIGAIFNGVTTGWDIGPAHRYLHSSINLLLIESLSILLIVNKYFFFKSKIISNFSIIFIVIMSIIDGHRSVWLCAASIIFFFLFLGEIKIKFQHAIIFLLIAFSLINIFATKKYDITTYFSERSTAFIDYKSDENSNWRMEAWIGAMELFNTNPITGQGFGGYWYDLYFSSGKKVGYFPHSLYFMTLVKMGIVGMLAFLFFSFRIGKYFMHGIKNLKNIDIQTYILRIIGSIGIINVFVYGLAYGLEYYSWLLIGLGLLSLKKTNNGELLSRDQILLLK